MVQSARQGQATELEKTNVITHVELESRKTPVQEAWRIVKSSTL